MSDETPQNAAKPEKFKRKRKKSFLKNARKYAKKGRFGRGTQLEPDTYHYFVRIMEAFKEGFDTDEDKAIFVNNVFEQTTGQEINCCRNQVGCRVVESLLPFANDAVLGRYMKLFGDELRPLCSDRFASHVLEALVRQGGARSANEDCCRFVRKVGMFLLNNLEDYFGDTYGSHIIRTCLETLGQSAEEECVEIVKDYAQRILHWPQFNELCLTEVTSGFLQVLLKTLKQTDKKLLKTVLEKLLNENFAPASDTESRDKLPTIFLSKPAMMVLETALEVAKSKKFTQIYTKCFCGRLAKLATTRSTNFAVQKLITNCKEKTEFEAIFEELSEHFKDIVEAGHTGIIWALAQGCKNFATKQGSFVQSLMKSLDCFEPEDKQSAIVLCLCKFQNFDKSQKETTDNLQKDKLNLHGTLILQLMLEFNKPIKIVNSLLSLGQNELRGLFSNSMGSHIVDSYVKSVFVGEKSRERLVRKLKGAYQELASCKYGSRSFEAVWNVANLKSKLAIMEELAYKEGAWSNSEHGKIIANKINLGLYKRNKEEWKTSLNSTAKAADLFAEIIK